MAHSQARELVRQGYTATMVAAVLRISRSSLYYQKKPHASRADRRRDDQIVAACGEKATYGYRRIAWWLQRQENLRVNGKRVLRVMRERGLLVRARRLRARRRKEWGRVEAAAPNQIWQSDMTKVWAGANVGWALLGGSDRLLHAGDRGMGPVASLPNRGSSGGGGASGAEPLASGKPRSKLDADDGQRNTIHFDAIHENAFATRHHA